MNPIHFEPGEAYFKSKMPAMATKSMVHIGHECYCTAPRDNDQIKDTKII